jgi:hypothetical protein
MRKGGSVKNMYSTMSTHNANRRRTDKSGVILKVQSLLQRCNCMEKLHNTFEAKITTLKKKGKIKEPLTYVQHTPIDNRIAMKCIYKIGTT